MNSRSPNAKAEGARNQSLPALLREEQLYGTRERDPFVPRSDTYYFKGPYLLVEDSTGEHRPIIAKEYEKPGRQEDPQWPVLWGGCEGRVAFYHYLGPPRTHKRVLPTYTAAAPAAQADGSTQAPTAKNGGHALAAARAVGNNAAPSLRRAVSMQALHKANAGGLAGGAHDKNGPNDGGYIAASGNSQIITSTNATSTRSGAPTRFGTAGGLVDKRLAVLSKRTVPIGAPKLKRSISVDGGLAARVPPPARVEPKKPGYCENCRVKYDDFKNVRGCEACHLLPSTLTRRVCGLVAHRLKQASKVCLESQKLGRSRPIPRRNGSQIASYVRSQVFAQALGKSRRARIGRRV